MRKLKTKAVADLASGFHLLVHKYLLIEPHMTEETNGLLWTYVLRALILFFRAPPPLFPRTLPPDTIAMRARILHVDL